MCIFCWKPGGCDLSAMVFQAGRPIESEKVVMFELSRVRRSMLLSSKRVDCSIVKNTQTMRKWHTAGIDRGLTVLVRVFYQDSQFLHTELWERQKTERERGRSVINTENLSTPGALWDFLACLMAAVFLLKLCWIRRHALWFNWSGKG